MDSPATSTKLDVVLEKLTRLDERQDVMISRLDILNGRVAKQESELNQLKLDEARQKGRDEVTSRWVDKLQPAIWAVITIFVVMALQNAGTVMKIFIK